MTVTHFALRRAPLYLATLLFVACSDPATDPVAVVPSLHHSGEGRHTVVVDPDGDHDATTIQAGIDLAPAGGRVRVRPGTYNEALVINKGLTLEGAGGHGDHDEDGGTGGPVVVAPGTALAVINVVTEEPVAIRGLTTQGGNIGIRANGVAANLTVEQAWVRDFTTAGITTTWSAPASGRPARLVVRHSRVEGGVVRPSSGISTQGDVNGLMEDNTVRGTANRCINVAFGSAVPVGIATVVDVVGNDLDRCGVASGINVTTANLQTGVRVANVVGNTIRNSDAEPIRNGIYFEGFAGRVEHNSILAVVQSTANPNPEAIAGCCVVVPAGIFVGSLRGAAAATPVVRFNDVAGNAYAGLRIGPNQPTSLDARCNYWGSEDGPSGVATGTGDAVLVETGGARPVLAPFATGPIARHRHHGDHHEDDDDDRHGGGRCHLEYSLWSEPVNVGPPINSTAGEFGGALSPDGLALYFNSNRPGSAGTDLWFCRRACRECPWGPALNLGPTLNGPDAEGGAVFSPDGRLLFFHAIRPEGFGLRDIYVSRRDDPDDDFGWGPPVNLGPYVNTPTDEQSPSYFRGDQAGRATLYFSRGVQQTPAVDIYGVGLSRAGEALEPAVTVAELNEPNAQDQSAAVRDDGREVIFASTRAGGAGGTDFWFSTRRSIRDPWTKPENLGAPLNTTGNEPYATLSRDGQVMLFLNARAGGVGMNDIWMSTRTPIGR